LEAAFWREIENIKKTPPSEKELARIKAQVISDLVYTRDSIADQASMIGSLESVGLTWRLMDQQLPLLSAVTPAQIQQVAKKYLVKERLTTAILNPNTKSKNNIKNEAPELTGAIR